MPPLCLLGFLSLGLLSLVPLQAADEDKGQEEGQEQHPGDGQEAAKRRVGRRALGARLAQDAGGAALVLLVLGAGVAVRVKVRHAGVAGVAEGVLAGPHAWLAGPGTCRVRLLLVLLAPRGAVAASALVVGSAALVGVGAPAAAAVEAGGRAAELRLAAGEARGGAATRGAGGVVGAAAGGVSGSVAVAVLVVADDVAVVGGALGGGSEDGVGVSDGVELCRGRGVIGVVVGVVGLGEGVKGSGERGRQSAGEDLEGTEIRWERYFLMSAGDAS